MRAQLKAELGERGEGEEEENDGREGGGEEGKREREEEEGERRESTWETEVVTLQADLAKVSFSRKPL